MNTYYGTVDIGGTKIMAGITDSEGCIKSWESFPTLELDVSQTMDRLIASLKQQCAKLLLDFSSLKGIGIVCAGPVDPQNGTIENPYTLPGWDHYPIVQVLNERTQFPVLLENDVNGALLGEASIKHLTHRRVLMIAFGTGIGCAFQADGRLFRAGAGFHPELGHILISPDSDTDPLNPPEPCYCGHRSCFENLWSGSALHHRAKALGFQDFNDLYEKWTKKDPDAAAFIRKIRFELQTAVWNLSIIFKPDIIILGGGVMKTYYSFAKDALSETNGSFTAFVPSYEILQADPDKNPALVGAMRLFAETI